jgi:propanol-preferring alcohol dehydrogenase
MRAMVLQKAVSLEKSPLQLEDVTLPQPGAGEVRVQVRCCGVCRTDLHIVEGDLPLPRLPLIPGHEIVGIVDAVGADVHSFNPGDRVGIPWLHSTDQQCVYCREGLENLCEKAQFTGYNADGGYAEYTVVQADYAYPIPEVFSDEKAAPLLCAGVIGYRSYRLSGVRSGQRLGLFGFGASAHLILQLARHQGCEVSVFTRAKSHRELAARLGASWVGGAGDIPPHQLDAAIIFAPAGPLVPHALRRLRKGATLALAGITMSPVPQMDYSLLYDERVIRSVANSTRQDVRDFLSVAAEMMTSPSPLQSEVQVFDLEQANQALQALKESQIKGAGVLRVNH